MSSQEGKSRGGPHNYPKPMVDQQVLFAVFNKYATDWADFGQYENLSKNQAVSGEGLAARYDFLKALLTVAPQASFQAQPARAAMVEIVSKNPKLNATIFHTGCFVGARLDRVNVCLAHLRRLAQDEERFQQMAVKCTAQALEKVTELVKMVELSLAETDSLATVYYDCTDHKSRQPPQLDERGFPRVLADVEQT